jgi:hypothetical protein
MTALFGLGIALAAAGACPKAEQAPPAPPVEAPIAAPAATPSPTPSAASAKPSREAEEACVDRWLAARGLDRYGGQAGTMYAGGTPLFDERTGERRDRLAYVYKQHPAAREKCGK